MKVFLIYKLIPLLLIFSCTQRIDCENLSMKKFKGFPRAAHKFDQECKGIDVKYTSELCQKALVDLIVFKNTKKVVARFGAPVMGCFTQSDLKRFRE